jgi:hypothetical protein
MSYLSRPLIQHSSQRISAMMFIPLNIIRSLIILDFDFSYPCSKHRPLDYSHSIESINPIFKFIDKVIYGPSLCQFNFVKVVFVDGLLNLIDICRTAGQAKTVLDPSRPLKRPPTRHRVGECLTSLTWFRLTTVVEKLQTLNNIFNCRSR